MIFILVNCATLDGLLAMLVSLLRNIVDVFWYLNCSIYVLFCFHTLVRRNRLTATLDKVERPSQTLKSVQTIGEFKSKQRIVRIVNCETFSNLQQCTVD